MGRRESDGGDSEGADAIGWEEMGIALIKKRANKNVRYVPSVTCYSGVLLQ